MLIKRRKGILARYSDLRYKANGRTERGAKGILLVAGPHSPNAGETIAMTSTTALAGSGIVAASVNGTGRVRSQRSWKDAGGDAALARLQSPVAGFEHPERQGCGSRPPSVREKTDIGQTSPPICRRPLPVQTLQKPWIAWRALRSPVLVRAITGTPLAEKADLGKIHFGADDNASGSASGAAWPELLAKQPRPRHVLLEFWSGEELGLLDRPPT